MRIEALDYLVCPGCHGALALSNDLRDGDQVVSGTLTCDSCWRQFGLTRGVPRLNAGMEDLEEIADAFTHEWRAHLAGRIESETLFGRTLEEDWAFFLEGTGLREADLQDAVVLDAGCGAGRLTRQMATHRPRAVFAVDINDAVDDLYERTRAFPNLHVVQANICARRMPS